LHNEASVCSRHSSGLEQFFASIQGEEELTILDWAGVSQANVSFITGLGHRLYSDDFLKTLDTVFGGGDFLANQADPGRVNALLRQSLGFPQCHFGGMLIWDGLQYLTPPLLKTVVDRLYEISKPGACLLTVFHGEEKAASVPAYHYRIADGKTVLLVPRQRRKPAQFFNNRALEKLFASFHSIKFFLNRDNLREVIVKR
jgi:hypothetical protein